MAKQKTSKTSRLYEKILEERLKELRGGRPLHATVSVMSLRGLLSCMNALRKHYVLKDASLSMLFSCYMHWCERREGISIMGLAREYYTSDKYGNLSFPKLESARHIVTGFVERGLFESLGTKRVAGRDVRMYAPTYKLLREVEMLVKSFVGAADLGENFPGCEMGEIDGGKKSENKFGGIKVYT